MFYYISNLFIAIAISDGPGLVYFNGFVGYHGKNGCKEMCGQRGHHKPGGTHYYLALFKPHNYNIKRCDHNDIDFHQVLSSSPILYQANLCYLIASPNATQYKKHRLEIGISKPIIFLGLSPLHHFGIPKTFGSDIMHLIVLNMPDLLINLWWKTIDCETTNSRYTLTYQ
ncbi:hypothetical protein SERLA73DRAFT_66897 [Serpula lacrymans var. lacrymans S7.3]|uniref:Uncharacterized protein n=1 Tax=Serpula lacrymans var. lacrymans (strain S7.3) TaxID=936435 RepID=F8QIW6_SERL3|nr:hypothetical protein SERLA73DRAFT_66897 [Serpula lacrymans var. lacrymans S7.3]